jgi:alpha-mannosidase
VRPARHHGAVLRHPDYTRTRIEQLVARVGALVHADRVAPDRLSISPRVDRIPLAEARELPLGPARLGTPLGPLWATYWLRIDATVPAAFAGSRVDLLLVTHSEATLWQDGRAAQGLNTGSQGERPDAAVVERAVGGERLELWAEIACNGKFGRLGRPYASLEPVVLDRCELARFDEQAWTLFIDLTTLAELERDRERGLDPSFAGLLLAELNRVCNVLDPDDRTTWPEARAIVADLYASRTATTVHELSAVGHAHIDTAWLWPLGETYRKCVRTFSSQARYMDRYPAFRFACSQAQQYAWIRDREPELYARIRERIARGQWLPVGGTWVEPDCNLPSGESLVRQFLHGQRFFERELGRRCTEFWNPDVFGYNAQLPQIMRGAGVERFLTQKLSWNRFTQPMHHTFAWEGLDGSRVLTHFPPADTYNAEATVAQLRFNAQNYRDHDRSRHSLMLFGYGDGGGGPTPRMLETLARAADLEGLPRTTQRAPAEFFDLLAADCTDVPTIVGELYFEYHRGTYTSQGRTKRGNRACERLLHDAELLHAVAHRLGRGTYPREALRRIWEDVLLLQFHDILPGSSVREVYAETDGRYDALEAELDRLVADGLAALGGDGPGAVPVNTLGIARRAGAELVAACGAGAIGPAPADAVAVEELADGGVRLANAALVATLGADGTLRSLVERASGREALAAPGNVLELYDDHPTAFDAWDVDPFHLETMRQAGPGERVPCEDGVAFRFRVGAASTVEQVVRLAPGARRLEFRCRVDWRESHRMLKVAFPLAVHARTATYEMQFGVVERPTHFSTPADLARYEVCGHRFADVSEHGFGVSLLSDCKYGWSCHGSVLRLSLLRAPTSPDPEADRGEHAFAYAVVPHRGGWREAGIVHEARDFDVPVRTARTGGVAGSFLAVDDPGLVLDAVKLAEDSDALVVRLYEAHGGRGTARIAVGLPFAGARRCTLLEDPGEELAVEDGAIVVPYRPFEIVSVLVT